MSEDSKILYEHQEESRMLPGLKIGFSKNLSVHDANICSCYIIMGIWAHSMKEGPENYPLYSVYTSLPSARHCKVHSRTFTHFADDRICNLHTIQKSCFLKEEDENSAWMATMGIEAFQVPNIARFIQEVLPISLMPEYRRASFFKRCTRIMYEWIPRSLDQSIQSILPDCLTKVRHGC